MQKFLVGENKEEGTDELWHIFRIVGLRLVTEPVQKGDGSPPGYRVRGPIKYNRVRSGQYQRTLAQRGNVFLSGFESMGPFK